MAARNPARNHFSFIVAINNDKINKSIKVCNCPMLKPSMKEKLENIIIDNWNDDNPFTTNHGGIRYRWINFADKITQYILVMHHNVRLIRRETLENIENN